MNIGPWNQTLLSEVAIPYQSHGWYEYGKKSILEHPQKIEFKRNPTNTKRISCSSWYGHHDCSLPWYRADCVLEMGHFRRRYFQISLVRISIAIRRAPLDMLTIWLSAGKATHFLGRIRCALHFQILIRRVCLSLQFHKIYLIDTCWRKEPHTRYSEYYISFVS